MGVLFPVQKKSKKGQWYLFAALLVATIAYCIVKIASNKGFLSYSNKNYYTPLKGDSTGFTGRANAILANALLDTNENVVYDVRNLNAFYRRLHFYYPVDSANYLTSIYDIRLDSITPANDAEAIFIKNSYLRETFEIQKKNRSRQFFKILFDPRNNFRISAVTIDPDLYKTPISSNQWKGEIDFADPFSQIDPNAAFIVFPNGFLPVFSSNLEAFNETSDDYKIRRTDGTFHKYRPEIAEQEETFDLLNDMQACYYDLAVKNKPLRLILGTERREYGEPQYMRFQSFNDRCEIKFNGIDSGYIIDQNQGITPIQNNRNIVIPYQNLPLKIKYKDRNSYHDFSIRRNSPLIIGSKSKNIYTSDERIQLTPEYADLFTRQYLRTLENNLSRSDTTQRYLLGLNPLLSKYLENELKYYLSSVQRQIGSTPGFHDVFEISMTLIDNKTGEVIAAPFYSTEFNSSPADELTEIKNFNFENHFIGSTFKPLLANAASIKFPSLRNFRLSVDGTNTFINTSERNCSILGYPLSSLGGLGFDSKSSRVASSFWTATNLDRVSFLNRSHDLYPIAMTLLALSEHDDPSFDFLAGEQEVNNSWANLYRLNNFRESQRLFVTAGNHTTRVQNMETSSFSDLLSQLYNVTKSNVFDRNLQSWVNMYDTSFFHSPHCKKVIHSDILLPEMVSLNVDIMGSDNLAGLDRRHFTELSSWVLGQGLNNWNNLKLAQAYARLFTKRDVRLSFWGSSLNPTEKRNFLFPLIADSLISVDNRWQYQPNQVNADWNLLLNDFRAAQSFENRPLLRSVLDSLQRAQQILQQLYGINAGRICIVGKTGTPDEFFKEKSDRITILNKKIYYDEGLYVFGLMNEGDYASTNNASGVTGVIYIKHYSENPALDASGYSGVESSQAKHFLSAERLSRLIFLTRQKYRL